MEYAQVYRTGLRIPVLASGYPYFRIPVLQDTRTQGYPYFRIPVLRDTRTGLRIPVLASGYRTGLRIPYWPQDTGHCCKGAMRSSAGSASAAGVL